MVTDPEFEPIVVIGCNWATIAPDFFPEAPLLWAVERDGVPLAIVKLIGAPVP
jgi:hypothetical protein